MTRELAELAAESAGCSLSEWAAGAIRQKALEDLSEAARSSDGETDAGEAYRRVSAGLSPK